MWKLKSAAVFVGVVFSLPAWAQDSGIDAAKQFFAQYVALEYSYDPGVADLYADEAFIKTRRSMPMGDPQDVTFTAAKYRALLRQNMPMAKSRGDRNTYSEVTYTAEGNFVRINALRVSEPKKNPAPVSLLVGPSPGGKWLIYEELSESSQ